MGVLLCKPSLTSRKVPESQGSQPRRSGQAGIGNLKERHYLPPLPPHKRAFANGRLGSLTLLRKPAPPSEMATTTDTAKDPCMDAVLALFPDICPEFLAKTAVDHQYNQDSIIDCILNLAESGQPYAKKPRAANKLKRKREDSDGEDEVAKARAKFDVDGYRAQIKSHIYKELAKKVLSQEFPRVHVRNVQRQLVQHGYCLLPAYVSLSQIVWDWQNGKQDEVFVMKKTSTVAEAQYKPEKLDETIENTTCEERKLALEELRAARLICDADTAKRDAKTNKEREEQINFDMAKAEGAVSECGCCFGDFALNRMIRCDRYPAHWFCVDCARKNAETAIGLSKYELSCMSMDGCSAGFSMEQRRKFLDDNLTAALDRIEYEAVLRLAGIENLETCPFCPYAAECLPVTEDKEFRCANPDCHVVSCRICRDETHIPKTCEEAARDHGISARRQIEEAMSAAMIRKCNKCATPFIKENGCNKMMCTRQGCRNVQCYVCSKSCDYAHFDDATRGGKKGNCPLFDSVEQRHDLEVRRAEEEARKKVVEENPDITAELLQFKMSEKVAEDDQKRKTNDPYQHRAAELRRVENIHGLLQNINQVVLGAEADARANNAELRAHIAGQDMQNLGLQRMAGLEERLQRRLGLVMNRLAPPQVPDRQLPDMPHLANRAQAAPVPQVDVAARAARQVLARARLPRQPVGRMKMRAEVALPEFGGPMRQAKARPAAKVQAMNEDLGAAAGNRPVRPPQHLNQEQQHQQGWLDRINMLWAGVPPFAMPFYGGGLQDPINPGAQAMHHHPDPAMVPYQLGFGQQQHLGQIGMNYMYPNLPFGYGFHGMPMDLQAQQAGFQAAQAELNIAAAAALQNPAFRRGDAQDVD